MAGTILLSWPGAESVFPFCGTAGGRRIAVNSVRERNFRRSVAVFFQYCIPCVAGRRRGSQESIGRAGFRKPVHSREGWKEYIERRMQQSREKAGMAADAGKMEFRLNGRSVCAMLNVPLAS